MALIVIYLLIYLIITGFFFAAPNLYVVPSWYLKNIIYAQGAYMGAVGGVLYCLRALYLRKCVYKDWDGSWTLWYYLRPIVSTITGFMSSVLLKAGLLALNASTEGGNAFGYYMFAFIAGYNVDNFLKRLEGVAKSAFGVQESRSKNLSDGGE